jgi:hypothetical protein
MVAQVRYSVAGRLGGRVTPCAICTMHMETRSASFLVWPQNQGQHFDLKTIGTVSHSLTSKSVATVSPGLTSKPIVEGFPVCASKLVATIW